MIKHTGLFDNIDKLYGSTSGATATPPEGGGEAGGGISPMGGAPEAAPAPEGAPEAGPEPAGLAPESVGKKMNMILETMENDDFFDFHRSEDSLNEINQKLKKLLND